MFNDFTSFVIFVLITSITPGPNNIASLSFSLNQGYRLTLPYMLGIISGVFTVQFTIACALLLFNSGSITEATAWLKYVGACYILYLAYKTVKMNIDWSDTTTTKPHFVDGFIFQAINPKVYFFTVTILTTFIDYSDITLLELLLLSLSMAAITFVSVSIWAGTGAALKRILLNQRYKLIFSSVMALGLVYTAYKIVIG